MIRFNLKKLLAKLEKETGQKILLKEVAEKSGCDKNALSRLVNHPEIAPSSAVVDKLVQYFFYELKVKYDSLFPSLRMNSKWLMDAVIKDFVGVYPDRADFWERLPDEIKENPESVSIDTIWSLFTSLHSPSIGASSSVKPMDFFDAMEPIQEEDGEYTIKFKFRKEQYDFLLSRLPEMIEVLFPAKVPEQQSVQEPQVTGKSKAKKQRN